MISFFVQSWMYVLETGKIDDQKTHIFLVFRDIFPFPMVLDVCLETGLSPAPLHSDSLWSIIWWSMNEVFLSQICFVLKRRGTSKFFISLQRDSDSERQNSAIFWNICCKKRGGSRICECITIFCILNSASPLNSHQTMIVEFALIYIMSYCHYVFSCHCDLEITHLAFFHRKCMACVKILL